MEDEQGSLGSLPKWPGKVDPGKLNELPDEHLADRHGSSIGNVLIGIGLCLWVSSAIMALLWNVFHIQFAQFSAAQALVWWFGSIGIVVELIGHLQNLERREAVDYASDNREVARAFRKAAQMEKRGKYEEAIAQFEDVAQKWKGEPIAANAELRAQSLRQRIQKPLPKLGDY